MSYCQYGRFYNNIYIYTHNIIDVLQYMHIYIC